LKSISVEVTQAGILLRLLSSIFLYFVALVFVFSTCLIIIILVYGGQDALEKRVGLRRAKNHAATVAIDAVYYS